MDEKAVFDFVLHLIGYVACFFCGYLLCKCGKAGLGDNNNICDELQESLGRSTEQVGDIESGLTDLSAEGERAVAAIRKYLNTDESDQKLEQDTDRNSGSEPDAEYHNNSAFSALDEDE